MDKEKLIRITEVMAITGLGKTTIWNWSKGGRFPKPIKLSSRITVWKFSEVQKFIDEVAQ